MPEDKRKTKRYMALIVFGILIAMIGIVLPEITIGQLTYINATTIDMVGFASYTGCTVANISEINHGNCSAVEDGTPWYVTVNFTNITSFDYIDQKILYYSVVGASTHVNDFEIYCVTDHAYVDLEEFTNQVEWLYYPKNIPDSMHFIDASGNVSIRLNHTQNGNTNHRLIIDTIRLVQKPTFEQNIINVTQNIIQGGGGGVSFDGNPVDLNGSTLYNGTNLLGTFNHSNLTNLYADDHPQYAKTQNATNYYVETTGSDANDCLSIANACATFQHVWNIIGTKNILSGNVGIYGGNGTFYEYIDVPAVFFNGYNITMYGQMAQTNLSGATGGAATTYGSTGNFGYAQNTSASWTSNAYRNKLLMNPAGEIAAITGNNATHINYTVSSAVFTTFTSGQPIIVLDWNTTIECSFRSLQNITRQGCAYLAPNAKLFLKYMKIKNNDTLSGQAVGIFGDFETQLYARDSYVEGKTNGGTVLLSTQSYLNTKNSVFVGDGSVVRLEKGSVLYDRNAASIYYLNGTTQSFKTAIFLYIGSQAELNEGFYIDGLTATANSKGIWAVAGSSVESLNGYVYNMNYGLYAQRNAIVSEINTVKFNGNTVNFFPTVKIDNSSIQ